ncbi:unknown [Porphyromonas sp. CAG:1061]|nr:unknown [Porphyromonas sp. CAG:1061]
MIADFSHLTDKTHLSDGFGGQNAMLPQIISFYDEWIVILNTDYKEALTQTDFQLWHET